MSSTKLMDRLNYEKRIMQKQLSYFHFYGGGKNPYFSGYYPTPIKKHIFGLKASIPQWYPDEMPQLYVTSPNKLYTYNGYETINAEGISHKFHTLPNGPKGCVQICHFKPETWDASQTCIGVFLKGMLWVQAYEIHLVTGKSIADIIDEWKRRM